MAQNLLKLATEGRAFDSTRPFTAKELDALITLEREADLDRLTAAAYVRCGILTIKIYEKAVKAKFEPKSLDDVRTEAVADFQKEVRKALGIKEEESDDEDSEKDIPSRDELEAQAKKLKIKISSRMKDETIWKKIEKATNSQ